MHHDTVKKWSDGNSDDEWAKTLKSRDYHILCPDNTQMNLENFEQCNLGYMAQRALVLKGRSLTLKSTIFKFYVLA